MDTSDYQEIRQLFDDYLKMYASRDDLLTNYFSEDFSGFTGGGDFLVKDREEWVAITRQDFAQVKDPLRIELKDLAIQSLSDTIAVSTSFFIIHLPIKDHILSRETARLVLIFRKESTGWKITHSSISIPYYLVRAGEVYPLKELTERNQKLEEVIAERTIQLSEANDNLQQVNEELAKAITEQKQAEETLRLLAGRNEAILSAVPDIVMEIDQDKRYTWANQAGLQFFGEDVVGRDASYYFEGEQEVYSIIKPIFNGVEDTIYLESWQRRKDGKKRLLSWWCRVLKDGQGCVTGALSTARDITERKRAEEEKQVLEERLQRAEKMEALGLLAGGVAHDLNNVIGVIVGYAELIADDVDESRPMRKGLLNIMEGGQRAAAIVQDLLTLARRGVTGRNILNLNRLILDFNKSPEWEKLHAYHSSVQLTTNLEADLLNISASPVHLQKTLFNLVSNAAEAMPKGGNITIKTTNQYLDKPVHGYDDIREGDYVVLSVSDTGDGIPEQNLKRIFEPFYTKKIMGRSGTGLGLAVVWGTLKDHQGYIDVESEEGQGTTFTLYFPVTRDDITTEATSISIAEYMGRGESILVVDDVKGQRDLAAAMLQKLNYKVASVASGEEALEYLKKNKVDLLVLDMIMDPGIDGLDTYKSILKTNLKQKAIIVSGFSESDRVHNAQALGAGEYVKKPYVIEKLGMAVKKELNR